MGEDVIIIGDEPDVVLYDPPESPPPEAENPRQPEQPAGGENTSVEATQLAQPAPPVNAGIRSMDQANANGGWAWVQKLALTTIKNEADRGKQMLARSVCLALAELDSVKSGNPKSDHCHDPRGVVVASLPEIAGMACCSRRSAQDAVKELERIGLVRVVRGKKPNSKMNDENAYHLLSLGSRPAKSKSIEGRAVIAPRGRAVIAPRGRAVIAPRVGQRDCTVHNLAPQEQEKESGGSPPAFDAGASAGDDSPEEGLTKKPHDPTYGGLKPDIGE